MNMRKLTYEADARMVTAFRSAAWIRETEDTTEELVADILQSLGTELQITIGGTTMFLAAWRDPDHWAEDWAEKLGCEYEEARERVDQLLADAEEAAT